MAQLETITTKGWYYSSGTNTASNVIGEDGVLFVIQVGTEIWKLKISMGRDAFGVGVKRGSDAWKIWRQSYQ